MTIIEPDTSSGSLESLAHALENDIRRRGLRSGDPYLSAAEAASLLGVSRASANRALSLMADGRKLVRKQGRGTFVGDEFQPHRPSFRHLLLLVPEDNMAYSASSLLAIQAAAREVFPREVFHMITLPTDGGRAMLESVLSEEDEARFSAVIVFSGTTEHYRLLERKAIPTLAFGSPPPGMASLLFCDRDGAASGRLLGEYLVRRGHQRIVIVLSSNGRQGTHELYEGVTAALSDAGLPPNALSVVLAPPSIDEMRAALHESLLGERRPTVIVGHGLAPTRLAAEVIDELGLDSPRDVEIVYERGGLSSDIDGRFTHVRPRMLARDIAFNALRQLALRCAGQTLEQSRIRLGVELELGSLVQDAPHANK